MRRFWLLCCFVCAVSGFLATSAQAGQRDLGDVGAFAAWARIEIVLPGPDADGRGNPNPFDIAADVLFSGPSGQRYLVPAFYDGDGAGGLGGNVWKVRFAADEPGVWTFSSTSAEPLLDAYAGSFTVNAIPADARGFYRWGRLEYAGTAANRIRYMKFRNGPYWLKAGCDDPENFLGNFVNFATPAQRKSAISYLAGKGVNSMYVISHNLEGDNSDVWPWLGDTAAHAKANGGASARFDVAKLAQWLDLFEHMMAEGVALYLVLEDDSPWIGYDHSRYYREMVARFGHLPALLFNMGEEYTEAHTLSHGVAMAQQLRDIDPYDHPIAVHDQNTATKEYLEASQLSFTAMQTKDTDPLAHNGWVIDWIRQAETRNVRVPMIGFDEPRPLLDRRGWWSSYLAGGVWEAHVEMPYDRPLDTWDLSWTELGGARRFMESLPFWEMNPNNALVSAGSGFCLAKPGTAYAVYLPVGGTVSVDLAPGASYQYRWWNPANGRDGAYQNGGEVNGGRQSFDAPGPGDWALQIFATGVAANTPPRANDSSLAVAPGTSVSLNLAYDDPDGPGPYVFTITRQPAKGVLEEIGGVWKYTPASGAEGSDTIGWRVSDGVDSSAEATLTIAIAGANLPPVANSRNLTTDENTSLAVPLFHADPDNGPGPYSFTIVAPPAHGALAASSGGNDYVYAPEPGFSGADSFSWRVNDGLADSNTAVVNITVNANSTPPDSGLLFADDFARPDSGTAGNGWQETEQSGSTLGLAAGRLNFLQSSDKVMMPAAAHVFPRRQNGRLFWEFDFDWRRTGDEGTYRVFMQLGDSALMTASSSSAGVGVNLVWTKVGTANETLASVSGGSQKALSVVSGAKKIAVAVNLDTKQYEVLVNGVSVGSALPFDGKVALDTVRFATDALNSSNFSGRNFDNLVIRSEGGTAPPPPPPPPVNQPPLADAVGVSTAFATPVSVTLSYKDSDGPGPYGFFTAAPSAVGQLSAIGSDGRLTYTPAAGFSGRDTFGYRVNDGLVDSQIALVTVDVATAPPPPPPPVNQPPSIAAIATATVAVGQSYSYTAAASDPDAGDVLAFSLDQSPTGMTINAASGRISWTPTAGQIGEKQVTVRATDGGGLFAVSSFVVTVVPSPPPVNATPIAISASYVLDADASLSIPLTYTDSDGPGPYTFTIVTPPANGELASGDASVIYTPDAGFSGADSFTFVVHDGEAQSSPATIDLSIGLLFGDSFDAPDSGAIGNGWKETEQTGSTLVLANGRLTVEQSSDKIMLPAATHVFPRQQTGRLVWEFDFDWRRLGNEGTYRVVMQLGDSTLMSAANSSAGVGVNLVWTGIGGTAHETLAQVAGGSQKALSVVSGAKKITVAVNLDNKQFEVLVNGVSVGAALPFDNKVALDTVRFAADVLNSSNFTGRSFDNLEIRSGGVVVAIP